MYPGAVTPGRRVRRVGCTATAAIAALALASGAARAATVTKTADTNDGVCDADCSLREAIAVATPGETVIVPAAGVPYEVTDGLGSLVIEKDLTIAGAGARQTEVSGPGTLVRPFTIRSPALTIPTVTIRDLSVTGGDGFGGGFGGQGGGVLAIKPGPSIAGPHLLLERVRVSGNSATTVGNQAVGGGVTSDGTGTLVTIRESLISANQAASTGGGQGTGGGVATFASGSMTIENTTIVNNKALGDSSSSHSALGGGASVGAGSVVNVTLSGNSALKTGGTLAGRGGNLVTSSLTTVRNTIITGGVAEEAGTEDCLPAFTTQSQGGNVVPASCAPGPADRTATDPLLGPLTDNGGPTDTFALLAGSPAIDAGAGCPPPATDQRGLPRPSGPACDSGAFELQVPVAEVPAPVSKPTCKGRKATIAGTRSKETLTGTKKADVIVALAGNDLIRARAGNDLVCAGKGKDTVKGGAGRDRLLGQKGADRLFGGPGKDALLGGAGKDVQHQ
jgi:CSLREA domain-containing protein